MPVVLLPPPAPPFPLADEEEKVMAGEPPLSPPPGELLFWLTEACVPVAPAPAAPPILRRSKAGVADEVAVKLPVVERTIVVPSVLGVENASTPVPVSEKVV